MKVSPGGSYGVLSLMLEIALALIIMFLHPYCLRVHKVQKNVSASRVWVFPPRTIVHATQAAFIFKQKMIYRSSPPPKILGPKAKNSH